MKAVGARCNVSDAKLLYKNRCNRRYANLVARGPRFYKLGADQRLEEAAGNEAIMRQ